MDRRDSQVVVQRLPHRERLRPQTALLQAQAGRLHLAHSLVQHCGFAIVQALFQHAHRSTIVIQQEGKDVCRTSMATQLHFAHRQFVVHLPQPYEQLIRKATAPSDGCSSSASRSKLTSCELNWSAISFDSRRQLPSFRRGAYFSPWSGLVFSICRSCCANSSVSCGAVLAPTEGPMHEASDPATHSAKPSCESSEGFAEPA